MPPHPHPTSLIGSRIHSLPTPCLIIDRSIFARNCHHMHDIAKSHNMLFRAHVKSHKTTEGSLMQLCQTDDNSAKGEGSLVISTIPEGWGLVEGGVLDGGRVGNVLFSLPPCTTTISRLIPLYEAMAAKGTSLQVMIDHPAQVQALDAASSQSNISKWSAFVKMDSGNHRAGLTPDSQEFQALIKALSVSTSVHIFGFYCHAGHSYASKSSEEASSFLQSEIATVNAASLIARQLLSTSSIRSYDDTTFVLSVGSTPTANAAGTSAGKTKLDELVKKTEKRVGWIDGGRLELHAGNYPLLDLQQLHNGMISPSDISAHVLASVCSIYPGRGNGAEAICDAGGLAMSKDVGPEPGYGRVVTEGLEGWSIGRLSQEHGILTHHHSPAPSRLPKYGEIIKIIPQHACLTLAAYSVYYVVDESESEAIGSKWEDLEVKEVWTPWKFW